MSTQLDRIEAKLDKLLSFGPAAPTGDGGEDHSADMPGEAPTPSGATLPWNAQGGEGKRFVFRGETSYRIVPEPVNGKPFTGYREVAVSQVAPPYGMIGVRLDNDADFIEGSLKNGIIGGGTFRVYFENGQAREIHLRPNPGPNGEYVPPGPKEATPCGHIQIAGGIPGQ